MTTIEPVPARSSLLERRGVFVTALLLVVGLSAAAELRSYARPDTGFLLDAAARVVDGARLYVDVVEINPPLIISLNLVVVLSARLFGVSEILAYRVEFTLVLLGAFFLAGRMLASLLPHQLALRRLLVLLLAFVLFPLAGQDYGEREHLVLALLFPYLLLAAGRRLGHLFASGQALGIGLLAGVAFALKPHFLLVWIASEAHLRGGRRVPWRTVLPETLGIAAVLAAYGVVLLLFFPHYLDLVRLLAGPYGRFLYDPFLHLLVTGPGAALTVFALLSFAALRPHARHGELWHTLALGTVACLLAGAAQQKGLRYHFYPAFGLAVVLLGLITWDTVGPLRSGVRRLYRWVAASVATATVGVTCMQNAAMALGVSQADQRQRFEQLMELVRERAAGEGVYVMSYHIGSAYPLLNYSGARSASRFPHLWILAAEYLDALKDPSPLRYREPPEMSASERYLNRAVLEDLTERRPRLLLILRHARDLPVNGLRRLDYVAYFGRDPRVAEILQGYQLVSEMGDYLVYERVPVGQARSGPAPGVAPGTRDVLRGTGDGIQFRLSDPSFLFAALIFLATLAGIAIAEREGLRAPGKAGPPAPLTPEGSRSG